MSNVDPELQVMVPPKNMWGWVGSPDDFLMQGIALHEYLVDRASLTSTSAILDVGCGIGKHAVHFARYLQPPGFYEGFDVEPIGIAWCQGAITTRFRHINFRCVDVRSKMYSPTSSGSASNFVFPYDSRSFDLVFLGSVFSHMFHEDVANYLSEIRRVLKPGGLMIATGYFLDDEKRRGIAAGTSVFTFSIAHEKSWIEGIDPPEGAVAHERAEFERLIRDSQMVIDEVRPGVWHSAAVQDQDFVIARRNT